MIVRELITKIGFKIDSTKLNEANQKLGVFKKKANDMTGNLKQAVTSIRNLGAGLTVGLTLPILGIGVAAVKASADIEMLTTDFETLLGSAQKGTQMVRDIREMAARTPFGTTDLARASKTLLSFGVNSERTLPILNRIGDVASGNKDRMKSLALVYGQVTANQKLMGQDLLQFVNAGFNPLLTISEKTGESMKSLRERMSKGEIGIDLVRQAFIDATSEGGRFYKGMERGSKTLHGRFSTLKDTFLELLVTFGDIAMPVMKSLTEVLIKVTKVLIKTPKPLKIIIGLFAGVVAALGPVLLVFGQLALVFLAISPHIALIKGVVVGLGVALGALATPAAIVLGILTAIGAIALVVYQNWQPISDFFSGLWNKVSSIASTASNIARYFGAELVGVDVGFSDPNISKYGSIAGARGLHNISQSTSSTVNKNVNLNIDSKVQVPVGTSADQEAYLNKLNRTAIREEFDSIFRGSDSNFAFGG